ncbi:MAG: hypothetical protein A4E46_01522 [Methanosaeta sp. PtaU1.Bin016]|jgi:hypothetical protein|nr:MAG: hypothetical protein A4E46_01522 [Methanosaeta sp. PtaU1.Bin016]
MPINIDECHKSAEMPISSVYVHKTHKWSTIRIIIGNIYRSKITENVILSLTDMFFSSRKKYVVVMS